MTDIPDPTVDRGVRQTRRRHRKASDIPDPTVAETLSDLMQRWRDRAARLESHEGDVAYMLRFVADELATVMADTRRQDQR